jgi:hypothetical protein
MRLECAAQLNGLVDGADNPAQDELLRVAATVAVQELLLRSFFRDMALLR